MLDAFIVLYHHHCVSVIVHAVFTFMIFIMMTNRRELSGSAVELAVRIVRFISKGLKHLDDHGITKNTNLFNGLKQGIENEESRFNWGLPVATASLMMGSLRSRCDE
jgi:hypothetical protein